MQGEESTGGAFDDGIGEAQDKVSGACAETRLLDVCLLAGKVMLQNGAETFRVEDTMVRIAQASGEKAQSFVTPTGIIFSVESMDTTRVIRVRERRIDLGKITRANDISRNFCNGQISLQTAYNQLSEVERTGHSYPFVLQVVSAAVASGCFLIMFKGVWSDFLNALVCGGIGFAVSFFLHRFTRVKFIAEFSAALTVGLITILLMKIGLGHMADKIEIASVMPLVPGMLIASAVRDLMAGDLVSGTTKGIEALLTAFAIGGGIAATLALL